MNKVHLTLPVLLLTCAASLLHAGVRDGKTLPAGSNPPGHTSRQDLPNILWIVSEDNSPFLGCYGDEFASTPYLDKLASEGILYENAFAAAPVCAPSRAAIITGVYPLATGTQHMRSTYPLPQAIRFFPEYLKKAGYYTSNNAKTDYNTSSAQDLMKYSWDESGRKATYKNRKAGQPFFAVFNIEISHESSLHKPSPLQHDPEKAPVPPYHPRTPEMKRDWAQYYDKVSLMDARVGELLQELEDAGLAENTIVFYYSDHGGVLGRSKRFLYESGLRVPLIVRIPEKYKSLAPAPAGSRTDRIVSFVDLAPTVLNLAGLPIPSYMHGKPFLGKQAAPPAEYAFSFRGRMDERPDLVRSLRDQHFRYIRNYMPHRINGQYLEYLWKAPSMRSWEAEYRAGRLNQVQSSFWEPRPAEELYNISEDPHNVHNLAGDPAYRKVLERMRVRNREWILSLPDVGFIPEAMIADISKEQSLYEYARSGKYALKRILETAEMASSRNVSHLHELIRRLSDPDPVIRYWAATGCIVLGREAMPAVRRLESMLNDQEISVRIAAAEALYHTGRKALAVEQLTEALGHENPMARLQALNALENMGDDAAPAHAAARALIPDDPGSMDYDVRAAARLVEKLQRPQE